MLGVRAPWRGHGLGLALLEHAFAVFAARGFRAVILGAEADSPTGANRLYERAGMRMTHRRARYQKLLARASPAKWPDWLTEPVDGAYSWMRSPRRLAVKDPAGWALVEAELAAADDFQRTKGELADIGVHADTEAA